jgi:hypothetical protein
MWFLQSGRIKQLSLARALRELGIAFTIRKRKPRSPSPHHRIEPVRRVARRQAIEAEVALSSCSAGRVSASLPLWGAMVAFSLALSAHDGALALIAPALTATGILLTLATLF